ncbi:hypothetical protein MED121_06485 [Marinomonas sp. MED121]|uniref:DUF3592 domain-containing protein n=1 Tax=Marinomonas sp. MED121 TaxID=314277 RepID=UPI00006902CF|nr:DUF3592 domain-containing protein [Marinomonas sp. MED121]EAQ66308.1 hypothetical protein MED121_06485 [Marinomonas sp. MED121]
MGVLIEYFTSTTGIVINFFILINFCLCSYEKYVKRWGALTGKYTTQGRITWSEYSGSQPSSFFGNGNTGVHAIITYSYRVKEQLYTGTVFSFFFPKKLAEYYPKGKKITVYYAPKDPSFSRADRPPHHFVIVIKTVFLYFIVPVTLIDSVSFYIYWLVTQTP